MGSSSYSSHIGINKLSTLAEQTHYTETQRYSLVRGVVRKLGSCKVLTLEISLLWEPENTWFQRFHLTVTLLTYKHRYIGVDTPVSSVATMEHATADIRATISSRTVGFWCTLALTERWRGTLCGKRERQVDIPNWKKVAKLQWKSALKKRRSSDLNDHVLKIRGTTWTRMPF
jgi:hypothetical protein